MNNHVRPHAPHRSPRSTEAPDADLPPGSPPWFGGGRSAPDPSTGRHRVRYRRSGGPLHAFWGACIAVVIAVAAGTGGAAAEPSTPPDFVGPIPMGANHAWGSVQADDDGMSQSLASDGRPVAAADAGAAARPQAPLTLDQGWRDETDHSPVRGDHTLRGVHAVDARHAWAVGGERDEDCVILRTDNGGQDWVRVGCPSGRRLTDVHFVDRNLGWAVGRDGRMFKSGDGGRSWFRISSGTGATLAGLHFVDARRGWSATRHSRINYTDNGGDSWGQTTKVSDFGLMDIHFVDAQNGWVVGSGGLVMRSTDGGRTWGRQDSGTDRRIHTVTFTGLANGWIAGNDIRYTNDGGASWIRQYRPEKTVESIDFAAPGWGYAVGDEGMILETRTNGADWRRINRGITGRGLRSVTALPDGTVWVVGTGGTILHRIGDVRPTAPPTRTPPPTETPRPTRTAPPSPTPTITPTATPSEPWVTAEWAGGEAPILVGPRGLRRVDAVYGNMAASTTISATLTGPVRFVDAGKQISSTVFSQNGWGRYTLVIEADEPETTGAPFVLDIEMAGVQASQPGQIAWQAMLGLLFKDSR